MDELVHHCLRELAFDGDLGCDVSRLGEFIAEFYVQNSSLPSQNVDDAFFAFVWSLVVRNPTVRVGIVPEGAATEVYVAPQHSAKRKAAARGEEQAEAQVEESVSSLEIIPDARRYSLQDLKRQHGDSLRIAVHPEASFAAITGSHIRLPKLSPMVYTALQLVTRGRQNGISIVDLGKKSGYDQKACFYLVKQLLEMDLVVKVRRGGVGSHLCIHKYFYERSPMWQQIRDEEMKATENLGSAPQLAEDKASNFDIADTETTMPSSLTFEPMDARHLSSLPLLRARIVKLLKGCKNHMHQSNNILTKLGFSNPNKTDRRFFQTRIRELIQQGVIEQVLVPNKKKNAMTKCFRLMSSDPHVADDRDADIAPVLHDDEREDGTSNCVLGGVKTNVPVHKQIIDILSEAGADGITLSELSATLCHLDRRTIELLLTRAERNSQPSHLRDSLIVALMETHGRERRNRYFTLASYRQLINQENFSNNPDDAHANVDFADVGGYAQLESNLFHETEAALFEFQDSFKDNQKTGPRKKPLKNPILPDGSVKRGRPRKNPPFTTGGDPNSFKIPGATEDYHDYCKSKRAHSNDRANDDSISRKKARIDPKLNGDTVSIPKKRGRPPKKKPASQAPGEIAYPELSDLMVNSGEPGPSSSVAMSNIGASISNAANEGMARGTSWARNDVQELTDSPMIELDCHHQEIGVPMTTEVRPGELGRIDGGQSEEPRQTKVAGGDSETNEGERTEVTQETPDTASQQPTDPTSITSQRDSTTPRSKVNVSHLRRENEFIRVIEGLGGIASHLSRSFMDAHMELIATMTRTGEPTSAPAGTHLDKRTSAATIDSLEARGRIKKLRTSVVTPTGASRHACVVYLPDVDQDSLHAFLRELGQSSHPSQAPVIKRIDEAMEYGAERERVRRRSPQKKTGHSKKKSRKVKHPTKERNAKAVAEVKKSLRRKAAESRSLREKDWEDLLNRIHPEPLEEPVAVRVRRVRARFMQSGTGKDVSKWENDIHSAIREAFAANKVLRKRSSLLQSVTSKCPPLVISNASETAIESLIAQQWYSRSVSNGKGKGRMRESEVDSTEGIVESLGPPRRHRFQWNRDLDELARDASAIVRARCRNGAKLDLAAFEQVFPIVPRNTVRQRLAHLRETPGNDAYMNRLEDKWYELWMLHKGTSHLPDEDPTSPSNFNLIIHIEFLRKHIDKNALRIGFVQHHERDNPKLLASIAELLLCNDVVNNSPSALCWDFMWNATVEEGREKNALQQAFTAKLCEIPPISYSDAEDVCIAEAALKMVFGMPHGAYHSDRAAGLLHEIGPEPVLVATKNLLSRGVLSKVIRDPKKSSPGRVLGISEANQNSLGGNISRETFQDAWAFEEIFVQPNDVWQEWNILAMEGDTAALVELVSEDKVEFKIDTSRAQASRPQIDWNSRKADDDHIETTIHIRCRQQRDVTEQPPAAIQETTQINQHMETDHGEISGHGKIMDGDVACCRLTSPHSRLVDCTGCLEAETFRFSETSVERILFLKIVTTVKAAGRKGLTKDQLLTNVNAPATEIFSLVRDITEMPIPILFWSGYSTLVLVHSAYLRRWTVTTSEDPRDRIYPRRWFDIHGSRIKHIWEAALKAVVGVILFRPGISEAELTWRLRTIYDRQEVRDVLHYLLLERFLETRDAESRMSQGGGQINGEEKSRFWFIGPSRHWYEL